MIQPNDASHLLPPELSQGATFRHAKFARNHAVRLSPVAGESATPSTACGMPVSRQMLRRFRSMVPINGTGKWASVNRWLSPKSTDHGQFFSGRIDIPKAKIAAPAPERESAA